MDSILWVKISILKRNEIFYVPFFPFMELNILLRELFSYLLLIKFSPNEKRCTLKVNIPYPSMITFINNVLPKHFEMWP